MDKPLQEVKVHEDPIFGQEIITEKPFDTCSIIEMYKESQHEHILSLNASKLSYLPELMTNKPIQDQIFEDLLTEIQNQLLNEIPSRSLAVFSDFEKAYQKQNIQELMQKLANLLQKVHFSLIPELLMRISIEMKYCEEYIPSLKIYKIIEEIVQFNIHIYTPIQLAVINYGLTLVSPKKCSLLLRTQLKIFFLDLNFSKLDPHQILVIYTAFKTEKNSGNVQRKCFDYLKNNYDYIKKFFNTQHLLPLNILYTYTLSSPSMRYRKKILILDEVNWEKDNLKSLYMSHVVENFPAYEKEDILRLSQIIRNMQVNYYEEIYYLLENYIEQHLNDFAPYQLSRILYDAAKSNKNRGIFSRKFYKNLPYKLFENGFLKMKEPNTITEFLYALTHTKALTIKEFDQCFGKNFLEFIQNEKLNYKELSLIAKSLMYLMLQDENSKILEQFLKKLLYKFSKQEDWVPIIYAPPLKLFLFYINKLHPDWNTSIANHLMYHAEKKLVSDNRRKKWEMVDYKDLDQIIRKLDVNLIGFMNYQNMFILDYSIEERKLALFLLKERDLLFAQDGEESLIQPNFELQSKILFRDEWTILIFDFREFNQLGEERVDWVRNKLEEGYKLTFEKQKEIHFKRRLEILDLNFQYLIYFFKDNKYVENNRMRQNVEEQRKIVFEEYKKNEKQSQLIYKQNLKKF